MPNVVIEGSKLHQLSLTFGPIWAFLSTHNISYLNKFIRAAYTIILLWRLVSQNIEQLAKLEAPLLLTGLFAYLSILKI